MPITTETLLMAEFPILDVVLMRSTFNVGVYFSTFSETPKKEKRVGKGRADKSFRPK